ncbi:3-hydroxyanthranilate 3,4-dioxygenase isoform X1 [Myxocyprinus asiaticus]|uniref:3-hydroxyanthranilate 3,4-dioxygenase isoform X1 n=1 Tax=Myxocyprinus asiaticus TaxID=70543 RepID=UPI0022224B19|nr:3-hydroxyanthranilate 3,4-dioxygenase isoform X1 [Myxocyprinus asiaticus]XP_051506935.1 3-hydroxyanthranilate 3,4-dioxygenase isoform X1 [Myxocyprinus asiaticus]XP_051506936.1 3-hydroxyanthranilate 3,4-dioxygenase isoform X1 [Myxocyprinus asiaticus]XP_051506937.1 3-hydroxyanthranilate 3,4-dioxygenase isoform X1 [Myxocyprinus asiaticus]
MYISEKERWDTTQKWTIEQSSQDGPSGGIQSSVRPFSAGSFTGTSAESDLHFNWALEMMTSQLSELTSVVQNSASLPIPVPPRKHPHRLRQFPTFLDALSPVSILQPHSQMFLLPARIPHSPQRQANTVGLVVERRRLCSETDGLRYFVDNSTDVLFERWFYCQNLGTQLVPIIKEFMDSKQHKTGKPDTAEPIKPAPYPLNTMNVMTPFCFREWVEKQKPALSSGQPVDMFGAQFETETVLFGPGMSESSRRQTDGWIWQLEGSSNVFMNYKEYNLSGGDCLLILGETEYQWKRSQDCVALFVAQDPERKRPY